MIVHRRRRSIGNRLRRDVSGLALLEFALTLPLVLAVGGWGVELSSLALCNLRVSQYALNLADAASRVGQDANSGLTNMREADANDVLQGIRLQGAAIGLTTNGRVTLSSLEADNNGNQVLHWQRCVGVQSGTNYDSSYGITRSNSVGGTPLSATATGGVYDTAAGVDTDTSNSDNSASHPGSPITGGMGDAGAKVTAPNSSGVMFVEVNYLYKPLFGSLYLGASPRIIHYVASFIVRDNRSFGQIYNPTPTATASTCNLHTIGVGGATS